MEIHQDQQNTHIKKKNTGLPFVQDLDRWDNAGLGNYSLRAYWTPAESDLIPSISTGFSTSSSIPEIPTDESDDYFAKWYVGLNWNDEFITGNSFGVALGDTGDTSKYTYAEDNPGFAFELFHKFQVTDNITVKPSISYLPKPFYQDEAGADYSFGGLVQTTFKF